MREKVFAWLGFHFIWVGLCVPMLRISYFLRVHLEWIDECHWRQSTAYEREWNTLFPILGSVRTHFDERECNFSNDSIFSFLHHRKKSVNFSNLFIFVQSFIHDAPKMSKYTLHRIRIYPLPMSRPRGSSKHTLVSLDVLFMFRAASNAGNSFEYETRTHIYSAACRLCRCRYYALRTRIDIMLALIRY